MKTLTDMQTQTPDDKDSLFVEMLDGIYDMLSNVEIEMPRDGSPVATPVTIIGRKPIPDKIEIIREYEQDPKPGLFLSIRNWISPPLPEKTKEAGSQTMNPLEAVIARGGKLW